MRTVQVYINDEIIDLFNDEKITVTSSVQNITDISKVYTDFSQTFTVPASTRNNAIFKHYYNNDVDGFIAKERQPARIEVNYTPFRRGKIQLEGAEIVNGEAQNYKITFYGDVVTLKDLFGDDKLKDLDYDLQFERNGTNVINTITDTSLLDVRFPLITSETLWRYGTSGVGDISNSTQAIDYTDLFPAVRVKKVFEAIEDTYGVTFNGNFLNDTRFNKLYTWWKHKEDASFPTESVDLEFDLTATASTTDSTYPIVDTVNEINIQYIDDASFTPLPVGYAGQYGISYHNIQIYVGNTSSSNDYWVDTYKNGILINSHLANGNTFFSSNDLATYVPNVFGLNDVYTFELRSVGNFSFDFQIEYVYTFSYLEQDVPNPIPATIDYNHIDYSTLIVVNPYINFNISAPDILVSEYFSGVLKMFNLTCYPLDEEFNFQIEPLETWYAMGDEVDITPYVDVDSIKVDRPKLYKEIEFKYKESKSFMNEAYLEINNRDYGSLREYFGYDGGDFKIELPFETLLFEKFDNTNLQVGYSLTKAPDYKPYVPSPVMLYLYNEQTTNVSFWIDDGTSPQNITSYVPFGQEIVYNSDDYSINFNEEISSLTLNGVSNSLYLTYYLPYLKNLFSDKTRIVTVKTILPLRLLNYLSLDDAIIIRDKKYRINDMRSDLTTGEVELVLISDWIKGRRKPIIPTLNSLENIIDLPIKPIKPNKGGYAVLSGSSTFVTPNVTTPYTITGDEIISFTIKDNNTGSSRTASFELTYYLPDGQRTLETVYFIQEGTQGFLLTEDGGYLLTEDVERIKV